MAPEKKKAKPLDEDDIPFRKSYTEVFPQDILEIILSRLPVKSLIRFKTICKSWDATISDRRFREMFRTQQSKSNKNMFLLWRGIDPGGGLSLIKLEKNRVRTQAELGNPFGNHSYWLPVNSCNGIVLLRDFWRCCVIVWNPSIRSKPARIPCPHKLFSKCWLYHDSRTDDYKVVLLSIGLLEVYSCKTGTWYKKETEVCSETSFSHNAEFVDGSFYWWDEEEEKVISFDVEDEKVEVLPHPHDLLTKTNFVKLTVLSGRLCLTIPPTYFTKLRLWVMEKDEGGGVFWKVLMDMEKEEADARFSCPYLPRCLTEEDDVVVHRKARVVVYDHRRKVFKGSCNYREIEKSILLQCCESLDMPVRI